MSYKKDGIKVPLGLLVVMTCIAISMFSITLPHFSYESFYIYPIDDPWILLTILLSVILSLSSVVLYYKGINPVPLIALSIAVDLLDIIYITTTSQYYIIPQIGFNLTIAVILLKSISCLLIVLNVGEIEFRIIEKPVERLGEVSPT